MIAQRDEFYLAGKVLRWHTNFGVYPQTIADHSHGVLALILQWHPEPPLELIKAATFHDHGEIAVGDIKSPAKLANPTLADEAAKAEWLALQRSLPLHCSWLNEPMPEGSEEWLKWADAQEALLFLEQCQQKQFLPVAEFQQLRHVARGRAKIISDWLRKEGHSERAEDFSRRYA